MMDITDTSVIKEDEKEFSDLKAIIKKKIAFNCDQYKQAHLKRRLAVRLRATKSNSYRNYAEILLVNGEEQQKLKDTLTVNVTELFRNPETYEIFGERALPEIVKSKTADKTIKIWSAGCSNGEEPYSIAIMLFEYLGGLAKRYSISILGTDIDEDSLGKAQKGIFQLKQLEKMSKERLERFFNKKDDNTFQIRDDIFHVMKFRNHDMISGPKLYGFDVIFCRNVTIYFEQELQEKLYLNFYNSLNSGGFFVMGKTETLIGPAADLFYPIDVRERIYQKRR
ncbi:MAG TPA: protein-glutamate O-methyltransferase CheR [Candidatus Methanoperedens sp.]